MVRDAEGRLACDLNGARLGREPLGASRCRRSRLALRPGSRAVTAETSCDSDGLGPCGKGPSALHCRAGCRTAAASCSSALNGFQREDRGCAGRDRPHRPSRDQAVREHFVFPVEQATQNRVSRPDWTKQPSLTL